MGKGVSLHDSMHFRLLILAINYPDLLLIETFYYFTRTSFNNNLKGTFKRWYL